MFETYLRALVVGVGTLLGWAGAVVLMVAALANVMMLVDQLWKREPVDAEDWLLGACSAFVVFPFSLQAFSVMWDFTALALDR